MKDAQKPDHVSLNTLVNYLRDGRFVIPDFQREFEWKPWDIRELEHFPKRMNRAGFPSGHESDSRIVLEGRPV